MTKPKILHVYKDYYPPVRGGIEQTINIMARRSVNDFDVTVLVCAGPLPEGEEIIEGVRVVRIKEWRRIWSAPLSRRFAHSLAQLAAKADLLHFHHPNPTGDIAYLLSGLHKPFVITYHSDIVRQRAAIVVYGVIQEMMMRRANVVMPTSPNYIESSVWLRRHRAKCRVVPLGIELDRFARTKEIEKAASDIRARRGSPLVIFVGRLRYYKGLHFLVEAMRDVDGHLLIVGTGPEEDRLRAQTLRAGLETRIHFLGDLDDEQLVAHLHAADVFCLPSHLRSEAFGICQIEAMACGLPVVSTDLKTGVPFVNKHGETGFVVPPADPRALACALNRLLKDEELRATFSKQARLRAQSLFSAEKMCSLLHEVYWDVLKHADQ